MSRQSMLPYPIRSRLKLLSQEIIHKVVHQTQLIQFIANFMHWKDQWLILRLVSKCWKDAIETKLFEYGEILLGLRDHIMPSKLLTRFCYGRIKLYVYVEQSFDFDPELIYVMQNLKEIEIVNYKGGIQCSLIDDWLKYSKTTLTKFTVNFQYYLPFHFDRLKYYNCAIDEDYQDDFSEFIAEISKHKLKMLCLRFDVGLQPFEDTSADILIQQDAFLVTNDPRGFENLDWGGYQFEEYGKQSVKQYVKNTLKTSPSVKYIIVENCNDSIFTQEEVLRKMGIELVLEEKAADLIFEKEGKMVIKVYQDYDYFAS